jgi:thioredoxin domain-containing protein 10
MEKNFDRYRTHFQFGWTGSPDLANSVAMETLSLPHLLVVNTTRYFNLKVFLGCPRAQK